MVKVFDAALLVLAALTAAGIPAGDIRIESYKKVYLFIVR